MILMIKEVDEHRRSSSYVSIGYSTANMLRVRNNVIGCFFCLYIILHETWTYNIRSEVTYNVNDDVYINPVIDWKCKSNLDCSVPTSSCVDGLCQCPDGSIYNAEMTSCIKVATTYGDHCEESIQCSRYLYSGGTCVNSVCVCAPGYYYMHGRCNVYSELLGTCRKNEHCHINGAFDAAICIDGICKCNVGFYQREYRACRPEPKDFGDTCVIDNDCQRFNNSASCNFENVCVLPDTDSDASKYLYKNSLLRENYANVSEISIGSPCTEDKQCEQLGQAFCGASGTCVCKRAHFFIQDLGKCVPELGEPCRPEDPLNIEYSACRNGKWNCELDRAVSDDNRRCEQAIKRYNNYCRVNIQCFVFGPDAICKDNACVCNEKSRFNETELFCWTKKGIGESCHQDADCYVDGTDTELSCTHNVCSCPDGTHPNSDNSACLSISAGIGSRCEVNSDCVKNFTKCVDEVCICLDTHYESHGECVPGINTACTEDDDCLVENSECSLERCACQEGYVAESVGSCIPVVSYEQPCEKNIQCSTALANTICSPRYNSTTNTTDSMCICDEDYHYNFEKCFKRKALGMSCENLGECYLDSGEQVVCRNGRCACDWGYVRVNDTVCEAVQRHGNNGGSVRTATLGLMSILLLQINFII